MIKKYFITSYVILITLFSLLCIFKTDVIERAHDKFFYKYNQNMSISNNGRYKVYTDIWKTFNSDYQQNKIVMFGDSITELGKWNEIFQRNDIVNRGIGSDTIFGMLNRTDEVISLSPKTVFIMAGINDIAYITKSRERERVKEVFKNYKDTVHKLLKNKINVIIQSTLLTRINKYNDTVIKLNKLILEFSRQNNILFIDLNQHLSKDGLLNEGVTTDGIHLNAKGYSIWKQEVEKYIEAIE